MKKSPGLVGFTAVVCVGMAWAVGAQTLGGATGALPIPPSLLAILNAFPAPADDPLLDSSGNVMMDSSGKPMSDPNEQFHQVKPFQFDPNHLWLVQAAWLNGTGCANNAGCVGGDPRDQHNEGLLLVKTAETGINTSALAELKKVRGTMVTELGYDIRKPFPAGNADARGSHCGAGAPRFNLVLRDGTTIFIGCNSPPPVATDPGAPGWTRLRWTFPVAIGPVERILILFDEGPDTGPDNFGAAFLDNIDVNGQMVGAGPTDAR